MKCPACGREIYFICKNCSDNCCPVCGAELMEDNNETKDIS
jgi:predicted RNA-binding Zn-ribbon protein involved in translation (DUF1610 family)